MGPIKLKTWISWAVVLFILGILADYYFLHLLFNEKQDKLNGAVPTSSHNFVIPSAEAQENAAENTTKRSISGALSENSDGATTNSNQSNEPDTFLESLKKCAPEIAAQTIATPEALIEYLRKSVGLQAEQITLENYHLVGKNGVKMRIHVIDSDSSNSAGKKELRLFKVDDEGYPDPVPLKGTETLESLLALGQLQEHEIKSQLILKDGGHLNLEMHNNQVFEFQYQLENHILSCRFKDCQCP